MYSLVLVRTTQNFLKVVMETTALKRHILYKISNIIQNIVCTWNLNVLTLLILLVSLVKSIIIGTK